MKLLLGLVISLCVVSWAQEETDSVDCLACLDESQRSQPIPDHAFCVDGELYDPFEGHNFYTFDPDILTDAQAAEMLQRYQQAYDALPSREQRLVDEGRLRFDSIGGFNVVMSPRVARDVDTSTESEK
ncbi:MAG: hypothetical protein AAF708_10545 [Deinococcota bacterium]